MHFIDKDSKKKKIHISLKSIAYSLRSESKNNFNNKNEYIRCSVEVKKWLGHDLRREELEAVKIVKGIYVKEKRGKKY